MTATDELRKLLEERGVKYYDMQHYGIWFGISEDGNDHKYEAFEQTDGLIEIDVFDLTPEQAITVTLVNKPDEIELTQTYDAGFRNGVMAVFQQLEGIEDYEELQDFIAEYWCERREQ